MNTPNLEQQYEQVQKDLRGVRDDLKAYDSKVQGEIKKHGEIQAETKAKVDELLTKSGELQNRLQDMEQKLNAKDEPSKAAPQLPGDFVAQRIAEDEGLRAMLGKPVQGRRVNIEVPRSAIDLAFQGHSYVRAATLTNTAGSGASLTYPADVRPLVSPLVRRLTVRDLLMPGRTSSPAVFFPRENVFTNNAGVQSSEGTLKGESTITFEDETKPVVTIAHWMDVSLQMIADVPYIVSYINGRLMYGLKFKEENELMNGAGVGQNIEGLMTIASAYSQPSGAVVSDEQALDRLRLMLLQVELADAFASGIVIHPTDWANIELLKDGEKRYIFTNPQDTTTGRLWGRDVVSTKAQTQGLALVGDFAMHSQLLDREDANVAISFENADNFVKNKATLRAEERAVLVNYRPAAFVKGSIVV